MYFKFSHEEQDIITMLHDFCLKEVKPLAAELDDQERFPMETKETLAEMGMMGVAMPEAYGGAGLSYVTYIAACEEFAKYCATTSVMYSAHGSLCCWPISEYGTEDQKQKYLTPLATGKKLGAFGLTEPFAGTDAAMQKSFSEDKGDYYLLNGSKIFITNGSYADIYVAFAMTTLDGGRIGIAAQVLGIAEGAIEECVNYVKTRVQFGKRISQFQNTQFQLADMQTKVDAARLLVYRAAQAKQDHEPYGHMAGHGQAFCLRDRQRRGPPLPAAHWRLRLYPRVSI